MIVSTATISAWETRKPLDSVGLVCTCGKAVASIEGVARKCPGCGTVYLITVAILGAPPQESPSPST